MKPTKKKATLEHTPAMRQFIDIKEKYTDSILFFRMGDFYEMFFDDAVVAAKVLNITLTKRDKQRDIPMCGIPYHAAKTYIRRLLTAGHKVALCEQMEDPSVAKGVVRREVQRVITPGVALEEDFIASTGNNFVAAVVGGARSMGFAYLDVLTGEFRATDLEGRGALVDELSRLRPAELLVPESYELDGLMPELHLSRLSRYDFSGTVTEDRLKEHFNLESIDGLGLGDFKTASRAAGALLYYVKETQRTELSHLNSLKAYYPGKYLVLDHTTRRNLDLTEHLRSSDSGAKFSREGTLLSILDHTRTSMGKRMIKDWISRPLIDLDRIKARLDSVECLIEFRRERAFLLAAMDDIYDLERLIGRVSMGVAGPRDLIALSNSLKKIPEIRTGLGFAFGLLEEIRETIKAEDEVIDLIREAISEESPAQVKDGGVIRGGYNEELDELRDISSNVQDWMKRLEADERKKTSITTLKVSYNRVFGYYINVPRGKEVPENYERKQTLVNAERYITPELKDQEAQILGAEERAKSIEADLYEKVRAHVARFAESIQTTATAIAALDVLSSFAEAATKRNYVKPVVTGTTAIDIEDGRHPVIEQLASSGEEFVPNDLHIDSNEDQIHIITGPNMAGKSTYMRQAALIILMAQAGCFVPAARAEIGVVDRIFTRVGASDDLTRGQSTFMVEMAETANILTNSTPRSFIILDEIGRGTSTFDGLSIAWAVTEYLHDRTDFGAKTLFATHYHELTELSLTKERVKNYNMMIREWEGNIVFLKKIVPGGSSRSYGIQVARLAGLPEAVTTRAAEILKNLESGELDETGSPKLAVSEISGIAGAAADSKGFSQPTLTNVFAKEGPVYEYISSIDLNRTTPLESLEALYHIKELLGE